MRRSCRRDFEHVLLAGESYRQTLDRAARKLDEAIEENKGGRIAIFTHTGTICILALHLMGALDAPELKPVWIHSRTVESVVSICATMVSCGWPPLMTRVICGVVIPHEINTKTAKAQRRQERTNRLKRSNCESGVICTLP